MLSAAKHLCAQRDRPFAARRRDNTLPILVVKIHDRPPTSHLSAPGNPSVGRIASIRGRIRDGCDGADKSAVGTINDSVGKLVSQAQMGMTFTLKASMDLEFPTRIINRPPHCPSPPF